MADTVEKIIKVTIEDSELLEGMRRWNAALEANKAQQRELDNARKRGITTGDEYVKQLLRLKQEEKAYKNELSAVQKELQDNIKAQKAAAGSYNDLQNQLTKLTKQYKALGEAEREGAAGQAMQKSIDELQSKLKDLDAGMKVYNRNVGNYQDAFNADKWSDFANSLGQVSANAGGAVGSIQEFGGSLKVLFTSPWVAAAAAVVGIISGIINLFKSTETATNSLRVAFAPLQGVFTAVKGALQNLTDSLAGFIADVGERFVGWLGNVAGWVDSIFGTETQNKVEQFTKKVADTAAESMELAKRENALILARRKNVVEAAKEEQAISELRYKAQRKDLYTAEERLRFIKEASAIQLKRAEQERKIAEEEWQIAKQRAEQAGSTTEELDAVAEKEATMHKARTNYYNQQREMAEKINSFKMEMENERISAEKEALEIAERVSKATIALMTDEYERRRVIAEREAQERRRALDAEYEAGKLTVEQYTTLVAEINAKATEAINEANAAEIKAKYDEQLSEQAAAFKNELLQAEIQGQDVERVKLDQLIRTREALAQVNEEWNKIGYDSEVEYQNALLELDKNIAEQRANIAQKSADVERKLFDEKIANAEVSFDATSKLIGGVMTLVEEQGEQGERYAAFSKALAIFQIAVDTASAIASTVKSAAGVPFPANIAAIASGVGVVLANIASATAILSKDASTKPKFHTGGVVGGNGEVDATLLAKESVMSVATTANFAPMLNELQIVSGGNAISVDGTTDFGTGYLYGVMRRALAEMPAPVVSVVDINRGQRRVALIEKMARRS